MTLDTIKGSLVCDICDKPNSCRSCGMCYKIVCNKCIPCNATKTCSDEHIICNGCKNEYMKLPESPCSLATLIKGCKGSVISCPTCRQSNCYFCSKYG